MNIDDMTPAEVLEILGQKYSVAILEATDEPMSAQELSDELGIPIATCYRRLEKLTEHGFLSLQEERNVGNNRRENVYVRNVNMVNIKFTDTTEVTIHRDIGLTSKLDAVWQKLSNK